ncbi:carbohydrate ABC transporter permease [Microcella frigidaquae]|uniref:ABC-type glycerol-3-phosphate transport system permease component n=1 Tax=Microcella frigidaquae TaxID=424758 RepID=A0A840XAS5_9MICO|nr:carbohydrate ABC transporter permease [Microcella frigidaquae]MBB5618165.1 ABC-type glycerol-3-phosphate transport system permease component [Microcella frigidaquae]NHN44499.1 carbohydrate ABC transporter permease [Microcella frigidaquae]
MAVVEDDVVVSKRISSSRTQWPIFIALVVVAATIVYPLYFVIITSLRPNADYLQDPFGLPGIWTFDNYLNLSTTYGAGQAFLNSMFVSTVSVAIVLVLASLAGFALAKLPVPGTKYITATFVSVMLIPGPVLIIPIYLMLARLDLVGTYWGLILVYVATGLPFATFFLTLSFRGIPDEVIEAARIDGAGFFRIMWSIVAPMGSSGVATLAVLQFLGVWNELIFAFILIPEESMRLLTPTLASIGDRFLTDQPLVSAGLFITASIPLILLAFASKYIMQGLQVGVSR